MKHLVGKEITKEVTFMGDTVEIRKLSFGQIMELQKEIQRVQNRPASKKAKTDDGEDNLELLRLVIRAGVKGADELSDEDFQSFPPDELNDLSMDVMVYIGLSPEVDGDKEEGN